MGSSSYQRVIDTITERIRSGELKPGDKLPTIVELADQCATSQTTVKTALMILRASGIVEGQQGKGVYVSA